VCARATPIGVARGTMAKRSAQPILSVGKVSATAKRNRADRLAAAAVRALVARRRQGVASAVGIGRRRRLAGMQAWAVRQRSLQRRVAR
jgi:hypothetical protein